MIFETKEQIKEAIDNPECAELLQFARERSASLVKYLTGDGLVESMTHLAQFCDEKSFHAMKKLARTTRAEAEKLKKPAKKVYTAKGGVRIINANEAQDAKISAVLDNITKGMSMKQWVQSIAEPARDTDPMSLTYTELDEKGNPYPTYKSTTDIHSYLLNGRKPEYVIFNVSESDAKRLNRAGKISDEAVTKKYTIYRVVDDAKSRIVSVKNKKIIIENEIPNFFGYVPGLISSDIPYFSSGYYQSPYEAILELLMVYFDDNASKSLFKKFQMHPKEWAMLSDCNECNGEGVRDGAKCSHCNGSGKTVGAGVAQILGVAANADGSASIPTPPGGYYSPGTESLEFATAELERLFNSAYEIMWETNRAGKSQGTEAEVLTATGELIRERGKETTLREFSKWAEDTDAFHSTNVKRAVLNNAKAEEVTVSYGRRYMMGKPEELLLIYADAKNKQMPIPVLNDLYMEVIESKYETNPIELDAQKKIFAVEPFPHHTIDEVKGWGVSDDIVKKKIYFPMWLNTITDLQAFLATEEQLSKSLEEYVSQFELKEPEEPIGFKVR